MVKKTINIKDSFEDDTSVTNSIYSLDNLPTVAISKSERLNVNGTEVTYKFSLKNSYDRDFKFSGIFSSIS